MKTRAAVAFEKAKPLQITEVGVTSEPTSLPTSSSSAAKVCAEDIPSKKIKETKELRSVTGSGAYPLPPAHGRRAWESESRRNSPFSLPR
jgi:hypothetical protein